MRRTRAYWAYLGTCAARRAVVLVDDGGHRWTILSKAGEYFRVLNTCPCGFHHLDRAPRERWIYLRRPRCTRCRRDEGAGVYAVRDDVRGGRCALPQVRRRQVRRGRGP